MIPYLVFAFYQDREDVKGGISDLFCQLAYTDDRTSLDNWQKDIREHDYYDDYSRFELIRINLSSIVEIDYLDK